MIRLNDEVFLLGFSGTMQLYALGENRSVCLEVVLSAGNAS